jgi:hypothetical protein
MRTSIQIAGKVFFLDTDSAAIGRRKRFFEALEKDNDVLKRLPGITDEANLVEVKPGEASPAEANSEEADLTENDVESEANVDKVDTLTTDEINILKALGIHGEILKSLAFHMPTFFESLPKCSSDTNLMLKQECDTAFYVLWSVLYRSQKQTEEAVKENKDKHEYQSLTDMAQTDAIVTSIDTLFPQKRTFSASDITKIFTVSGNPGGEAFMELLTLVAHVSERKPLTSRQSQILELFRFVPLY